MIKLQRKAVLLHITFFYYAWTEVLSNFGLCSDFGIKLIDVIEINAGVFVDGGIRGWHATKLLANMEHITYFIMVQLSIEKYFYKCLDMKKSAVLLIFMCPSRRRKTKL